MLFACCIAARAGTVTDRDTNLHFPDRIGEWNKTQTIQFPDPRLGLEINYKSHGDAIASFVVYNGGTSKIPTGAENRTVQSQFNRDLQASMAYVQQRAKDVSKILDSKPEVSFHGKRATVLVTAFQFSADQKWVQYFLMTGYKNRFLKLLYTQPCNHPKTDIPEGQKRLRDLIFAWLDKNDENRDAFWQ